MHTFPIARGRRLAFAGLAACFTWAGVPAIAASTPTDVTMSRAGDERVRHGRSVTVRGRITPPGRGWAVRLHFAPRGEAYAPVAGTRTAADGSYALRYRVTRSGKLRALAQRGRPSPPLRVTVISSLRASMPRHILGLRAGKVTGRVSPAERGRRVRLQASDGSGWRTVKRTRTRAGGRFATAWRPRRAGVYRLRVVVGEGRRAAAARLRSRRAYVYRPGPASYYGPGLYGNPTSCGGTLTAGRLGVAHKTLRCGTQVTFRHRGRSVTVPVIDRGPFVAGREWDLTAATKDRLGFGSTGTVWSTR